MPTWKIKCYWYPTNSIPLFTFLPLIFMFMLILSPIITWLKSRFTCALASTFEKEGIAPRSLAIAYIMENKCKDFFPLHTFLWDICWCLIMTHQNSESSSVSCDDLMFSLRYWKFPCGPWPLNVTHRVSFSLYILYVDYILCTERYTSVPWLLNGVESSRGSLFASEEIAQLRKARWILHCFILLAFFQVAYSVLNSLKQGNNMKSV